MNEMEKIMIMIPVLFLIFLTLKLTGYPDLSWWVVCSPVIGVILFYGVAFLIGLVITIKRIGKMGNE